ncbi:hypothetical protein [Halorubrum sp. F4]|uniref:hypothetical protein n=1 Tax=Halorubrum sp. F4 TaxID=2989715 RepID=UPI002480421B|nr:hypothetical protein [Halorubrum sp. F4]
MSSRSTSPGAGHVGPLVSARCTSCEKISEKRTARIVGETSSGSFRHVCHTCRTATWWNVLRIIDENHPGAGRGST